MKFVGIVSYTDHLSMKQFIDSELAATPLGLLFIALTEERTWSDEYGICGYWIAAREPRLEIRHAALNGQPLIIHYKDGDISVRDIQKAVLAHVGAQLKISQLKSEVLHGAVNTIHIAMAKAFAAHELQISEDRVHFGLIGTKWATGYNPHIVETVVLQILDGPRVDVDFGLDNLPAKVTLVPKPHIACLQ